MNCITKMARAKKFILNQLFVTNFYFKGTQQFTGFFPNHDWLCHPWPPFLYRGSRKKVAKGDKANYCWENTRVTKPIIVGKTPCKLLCGFKVKVCNK